MKGDIYASNNLTITHLKDLKRVNQDLSLAVKSKGDKVAIISEENCGKSTLLKLLLDEATGPQLYVATADILISLYCCCHLPQQSPSEGI